MQTAVNSIGEKICLIHCSNKAINELKGELWLCPACQSQLILKNGQVISPHFAHKSLNNCYAYSENESASHLFYKRKLYEWCSQNDIFCEVEAYLPELKQTPDLLILKKIAVEIQCSPLSIERFIERTLTYKRHGYYVIWIIGDKLHLKSHLSALQKHFCYYSIYSGVYCWQISSAGLTLLELIHQSVADSIVYQRTDFPYFSNHLLSILRLPFKKHTVFLSKRFDYECCQSKIQKMLSYKNKKWMAAQFFCYQNGLVLQELSEIFLFPSIYSLFYSPIQFRIRLYAFLCVYRKLSEIQNFLKKDLILPFQINAKSFLFGLICVELYNLKLQHSLLIKNKKYRIKYSEKKLVYQCVVAPFYAIREIVGE